MCDCMRYAPAEGVRDWRCPECGTWYVWVYAEMDGYWKPQTLPNHSEVKRTWDEEQAADRMLAHATPQENVPHPAATGAATTPVVPVVSPEAFGMDELPGQVVNTLVGHYAHPSAIVDAGAVVGLGTKIWHFGHIMAGARIGERCVLGQNVHIASGVHIGDGVKIQNNVSLYDGCVIEDDVFIGPSAVFTNVKTPRAFVNRHDEYLATRVCRGASIGANATVVCGVIIGQYAIVGAGSVVTKNVRSSDIVAGVPARLIGIACRCGTVLVKTNIVDNKSNVQYRCRICGAKEFLRTRECPTTTADIIKGTI